MHHGHAVAPALLARCHGHGLPVGQFFLGTLALELEHAALGHQRRDAGHTQLGGFFYQPVHALVGGDARQQVHGARGFALDGVVGAHLHAHIAAAHAQHGGIELAPGAVGILAAMEQRDAVTRLQAQHLHMARGAGGQINLGPGGQGRRAMETGHLLSLI